MWWMNTCVREVVEMERPRLGPRLSVRLLDFTDCRALRELSVVLRYTFEAI